MHESLVKLLEQISHMQPEEDPILKDPYQLCASYTGQILMRDRILKNLKARFIDVSMAVIKPLEQHVQTLKELKKEAESREWSKARQLGREEGFKAGYEHGFKEAQEISKRMRFEAYNNGKMAGTIETEMRYHDEQEESSESASDHRDDGAGTCDSQMVESGTERTVDSEDAPIFRQHDYDTYLNGNQGWRFTDGSGRKLKWLRSGIRVEVKRSRRGFQLR